MTANVGLRCLTIIFLFALLSACERKPQAPQVHFVDGSDGLPTSGQWRQRIAVADLDGDGKPEIIAPPARVEKDPHPHIWSRNGEGRWEEKPNNFPQWPYDYGDVTVADFDRDGHPDLAFASHAQGVVVLKNRGQGQWELMTDGLPASGEFPTRGLTAGDLDGDGWPDIAAVFEVSSMQAPEPLGIRIYLNQGGKGWRSETLADTRGLFGDRILMTHLGDAKHPALIVGGLVKGDTKIVWVKDTEGWRALSSGIPDKHIFWGADVCDVAGNGRNDLFLATDSTRSEKAYGPRVLRLQGSEWADLSTGLPSLPVRDIASGDLEGNKSCTLATVDTFKGSVLLFRWSQDQKWTQWATLERPSGIEGTPYAVTIADVDGDGLADVLVNYAGDSGSGGIHVWLARR